MKLTKLLLTFSTVCLLSTSVFACDDCDELTLTRYTGVGVAAVRPDDPRPLVVKQLFAIRAAKLEALRSLAEQTQGVKVSSKSESIGASLLSDRISVESQTILQGVRFIKVEPIENGVYQAIAEIDLYDLPSITGVDPDETNSFF